MARKGSAQSGKPFFGQACAEVDGEYFNLKEPASAHSAHQRRHGTEMHGHCALACCAEALLDGYLRKKGKIFNNEREVKLDTEGRISYYHLDKPGIVKGLIDLKSVQVKEVRFSYAGRRPRNQVDRPAPHVDD